MLPASKAQRRIQHGQANTVFAVEGNRGMLVFTRPEDKISGVITVSTVTESPFKDQCHLVAAMGMFWNTTTLGNAQTVQTHDWCRP